jgi:hypothetical protein
MTPFVAICLFIFALLVVLLIKGNIKNLKNIEKLQAENIELQIAIDAEIAFAEALERSAVSLGVEYTYEGVEEK